MAYKLTQHLRAPVSAAFPIKSSISRRPIRSPLTVRASDDEDIVPIITGRKKDSFTPTELEHLKHPHLIGGRTMGEELALLREKYLESEEAFSEKAATAASGQWNEEGEWVGGNWNVLSVLYVIAMAAPAATGLFAWLSYGKLWGVEPFYM